MRDIHTPNYSHSSYMEHSIRPDLIRAAVNLGTPLLQQYDFDAFAFRGVSGTLLAVPFALALDKTLLMVRKNIDECHSKLWVEGDVGARRYIIIDDFISTGHTVRTILAEVEVVNPAAVCIGVLEVLNLFDGKPCDVITPGFERKFRKLTKILEQRGQLA